MSLQYKTMNCGDTNVEVTMDLITVTHTGDKGNTITLVEENIDKMLGAGVFRFIQRAGVATGDPEKVYTMVIHRSDEVDFLVLGEI